MVTDNFVTHGVFKIKKDGFGYLAEISTPDGMRISSTGKTSDEALKNCYLKTIVSRLRDCRNKT